MSFFRLALIMVVMGAVGLGHAAQVPGTGLTAQYYTNPILSGKPFLQKVDPIVDFNWGSGAPEEFGTQTDKFSIRWIGQLVAPASGTWTISGTSDDGLIIQVDGKLIINDWSDHSAREKSGAVDLIAGKAVPIEVTFYENGGQAVAKLAWTGPGVAQQIIPQTSLYPFSAQPVIPTSSFTSPVFVESRKLPGTKLKVTANGAEMPTVDISDSSAFANIGLDQNQPTTIAIGSMKSAVTWSPTVMAGDHEQIIRLGDSLLFQASVTGSWRIITTTGVYRPSEPIAANALASHLFAQPGSYLVEARNADDQAVSTTSVVVVAVGLPPAIACEVQYERATEAVVSPAGAPVAFVTNDPAAAQVTTKSVTGGLIALQVKPLRRGMPAIVARIGGLAGPIVSMQQIDEFILNTPAIAQAVINARTEIGHVELIMTPFVPNVDITAEMFAHRSTFKGGAMKFVVNTSGAASTLGEGPFTKVKDPVTNEDNGSFVFSLEIPAGENRYCFSVVASQSTIAVGVGEGAGSSTAAVNGLAPVPFGIANRILAALLFADGGGSPQGSPKKNVNGKACKVAGYNTLIFAQSDDPNENEKKTGNKELWKERTYSLLTSATCDSSVSTECADVSYKLMTKSPGGRKVDSPLNGLFKKTDKEESECDTCPHDCKAFDTMKTGTKTGKHPTKVGVCSGKLNDGTEIGAFELAIIDASGPSGISNPFPADALVLKRRRGILFEGSGENLHWVGEPVIQVVSGGDPVITDGQGKGSQAISFYGVQCAETNKWTLRAIAAGFDGAKHEIHWFVEDAMDADGKTEIDNDSTYATSIEELIKPRKLKEIEAAKNKLEVEIKPSIDSEEIGRFNIVMLITQAIKTVPEGSNSGETYLQVVGKAEIHSLVVEKKHSTTLKGLPKPNADGQGFQFGSQFALSADSGGTAMDSAVYVIPSGKMRGRVSLDKYPQNEYWAGPEDSLDIPQALSLPHRSKALLYVQGYGAPSSNKNDMLTLAVDGQALIEQCDPVKCGDGPAPEETFGGNAVDWMWQRCDTEKFVSVEVVVHPNWDDFAAEKRGRLLQSIRSDLVEGNQFYTTTPSTFARKGAQRQQPEQGGPGAKTLVTISAHVRPYDYVAGQKLQFATFDTHDISPYNMGNKRERLGTVKPVGGNTAVIKEAQGYGANTGIAEIEIDLATACGGDQFRILAADSSGNLYGYGDVLSVWRKMYIESDSMYTQGTIVTGSLNVKPGNSVLVLDVHRSDWVKPKDNIVIFSPDGLSIPATVQAVQGLDSINIVANTTAAVQVLPNWGVRPAGNVPVTSGPAAALTDAKKKAFGRNGNFGEDGGAFTEFAQTPKGVGPVPFYQGDTSSLPQAQLNMIRMADVWFGNRERKDNVAHLIYGLRLVDSDASHGEPGGFAEALPKLSTSNNVFLLLGAPFLENNPVMQAQAGTHEFGHILGVIGGGSAPASGQFPWVDPDRSANGNPMLEKKNAHDEKSFDIMDYASDLKDAEVEFSTDVLIFLRKRQNPDK